MWDEGIAILHDWLGDGGEPVSQAHADARASVCLPCPENKHERWWEHSKTEIAALIRRHLEVKNHFRMRAAGEDQLRMCCACGCSLPLKVWTPIAKIASHTSAETMKKYPAHCWVPKEIDSL